VTYKIVKLLSELQNAGDSLKQMMDQALPDSSGPAKGNGIASEAFRSQAEPHCQMLMGQWASAPNKIQTMGEASEA